MSTRRSASIALSLAALSAGCEEPAGSWAAPSSTWATPPESASAAWSRPRPSATASAAPRPARLELERFRLASGVENREPIDHLAAAGAGQRVYAHATIRNRTGATRHVSLVFRVDKEERTTVDLEVEPSWSWRTWGYVTLRPGDEKATLDVELRDDNGDLLAERTVPIEARPSAKLR